MSVIVFRSLDSTVMSSSVKTLPVDDFDNIETYFKQDVPPNPPGYFTVTSTNFNACRIQIVPRSASPTETRFDAKFEVFPVTDNDSYFVTLIQEAFVRAKNEGSGKSVVLFVHGTANSLPISIEHGYSLRERFNCEPIVFSWSGGVGGGGLAAYIGAVNAYTNAVASKLGFERVMRLFNDVAKSYTTVPAILLLRSAGSAMFFESIASDFGSFKGFADSKRNKLFGTLKRIVLSAPLVQSEDFARLLSAKYAPLPPIFVTVNSADSTLKRARWLPIKDPKLILGKDDKTIKEKKFYGVTFLHFKKVGTLHDYMLPEITDQQDAVHKVLLSGEDFDTVAGKLKLSFELSKGGEKIFDVN